VGDETNGEVDFWVWSCQQASGGDCGEGTTTDEGMERIKTKKSVSSVSSVSNFSVLSWRKVV